MIPTQEREETAEMEVVHERVYTDEVLVAGTLHREEAVHLQVKYNITVYYRIPTVHYRRNFTGNSCYLWAECSLVNEAGAL